MFEGQTRMVSLTIEGNSITGYCILGPAGSMHECLFDTGAQFTAVPQSVWSQQFSRQDIDIPAYQNVNRRSVFGHICRAKRVPLQVAIMGNSDPDQLIGAGSDEYADDLLMDFGECLVDFLFDQDAASTAAALERDRLLKEQAQSPPDTPAKAPAKTLEPLKYVYIGLGGGTFRNGGLCINWVKPEAVLVEQLG